MALRVGFKSPRTKAMGLKPFKATQVAPDDVMLLATLLTRLWYGDDVVIAAGDDWSATECSYDSAQNIQKLLKAKGH